MYRMYKIILEAFIAKCVSRKWEKSARNVVSCSVYIHLMIKEENALTCIYVDECLMVEIAGYDR